MSNRTMLIIGIISFCFGVCGVVAQAKAETVLPKNVEITNDVNVIKADMIAKSVWKTNAPHCEKVRYYLVHGDRNGNMGYAYIGYCDIWIVDWVFYHPSFKKFCQIVVHEFGHVLGFKHDSKFHVMSESFDTKNCPKLCKQKKIYILGRSI